MKYIIICLSAITLLSSVATAQNAGPLFPTQPEPEAKKFDTRIYAPDYCDFSATFPEEPYITNQCEDPNDKNTCYNLISYTKVFGLSSTVRAEIICNPGSIELYERFSTEVMEATVREMTKETVSQTFEVKSREEEKYRQTSLFGKGKKGLDETIYLAQLWVSQSSIMSVEAEMIGEQNEEADALFAEILRNIGHTETLNAPTTPFSGDKDTKDRDAHQDAPPIPQQQEP